MTSAHTTTASAPGKVLLTGGYLVLDPAYEGVVISTTARFYSTIRTVSYIPSLEGAGEVASGKRSRIVVTSPQFQQAVWSYDLLLPSPSSSSSNQISLIPLPHLNSTTTPTSNKFVELALRETLKLVGAMVGMEGVERVLDLCSGGGEGEGVGGLEVEIKGDNSFYSQRETTNQSQFPPTARISLPIPHPPIPPIPPPFSPLPATLLSVHKTGLGSSACLITSLVASLLVHFQVFAQPTHTPTPTPNPPKVELSGDNLNLIHNTAQYIHCLAQGKIGSGFDVASAVFGGQRYRRFGEGVLGGLLERGGRGESTGEEILETVTPSLKWTTSIQPLHLPPHIHLLLADINGGSDTPSMAGKVLRWRKANPLVAEEVWEGIKEWNGEFARGLGRLGELAEGEGEGYGRGLEEYLAGERAGSESELGKTLDGIKEALKNVRRGMKRMGELVDVPIEPDEQTRLLDECVKIPGVIGGGVPGAGGYDALYLLVIDTPDNHSATLEAQRVLTDWKEMSVCVMDCEATETGLRVE